MAILNLPVSSIFSGRVIIIPLPIDFDGLPYAERGYCHTFFFQNDRKPTIG